MQTGAAAQGMKERRPRSIAAIFILFARMVEHERNEKNKEEGKELKLNLSKHKNKWKYMYTPKN